jgi:ankyrin repeat protein
MPCSVTRAVLLLTLFCSGAALSVAAQQRSASIADAAQQQDWTKARALLSAGAPVDAPQPDGATALAWAVHWDEQAFADVLIRAGADVNAANDHGVTPLALASANSSAAMVDRLLKAGADPNGSRGAASTPLIAAARTGNVGTVKLLLAHGADVKATPTSAKQTALMWAISERKSDVTRVFVEAGADVNARSAGGFTPLLFAARHGDTASAAILIDAGARPDDAAADGATPLVVAAASGREETALLLLERGANPSDDRVGYTALHAAVPKNALTLVKALLARGADPNARLRTGPAAIFGRSDGAGTEVRPPAPAKPAPPPTRGRSADGLAGATPFWLAAREVNVPVMSALLEGRADPRLTPPNGTTPFMVASGLTQVQGPRARRGDVSSFYTNWNEIDSLESVRFLAALGADINATNLSGQTALHGAAYMGGNSVVEFLLEKGAKLNVQDAQGQTPYRIAEGHLNIAGQSVTEWPKTAALLRERGADVSLGVDGRTMLRKYGDAVDRATGGR